LHSLTLLAMHLTHTSFSCIINNKNKKKRNKKI
jgi:hypothetical protein